MADGGVGDYDPLFTMDVVREFMLAHDGKVSNHMLVTHFKSFLNDSRRKVANRQKFKEYVNTLAAVKLDVSGEKLLVLKKKFRDSGSFRSPAPFGGVASRPAVASAASGKENNAKRPKRDEEAGLQQVKPKTVDTVSENVKRTEDKENLQASSFENLLELVSKVGEDTAIKEESEGATASDNNIEMTSSNDNITGILVADEAVNQVEMSEPQLQSPVEDCQPVEQVDMKDKLDFSSDIGESQCPEILEEKPVEKAHSIEIAPQLVLEDVISPAHKEPTEESTTESSAVSVREMAKNINRMDSGGNILTRHQGSTPVQMKPKRDRESRRPDDTSGYEFTLNDVEREWTIRSAYSDYQTMAKLLQSTPSLASRRDFLSGYTALHWAAKNGCSDVIKLLFGSPEPPAVDTRSSGGYTPLHLATKHGREEVIQLLIEVYHANPNLRDYSGRKPKHYMPATGLSATVQQLLKPPPPKGRSSHLVLSVSGDVPDGLPSPLPSPGPSSRKGSTHSDTGLMPPPKELPAVVRRRPVVSVSSASSGGSGRSNEKESYSDSEMHSAGPDGPLHGSDSTPNFGVFI